jgi:hypothetical protein
MLHRVALVRTDVSEELSASIIRVTRISELGTLAVTRNRRALRRTTKLHLVTIHLVFLLCIRRLLVTANVPTSPILVTLMMEAVGSSETSFHTRATRRNIPEDTILHSHRLVDLKSYMTVIGSTETLVNFIGQHYVTAFFLISPLRLSYATHLTYVAKLTNK